MQLLPSIDASTNPQAIINNRGVVQQQQQQQPQYGQTSSPSQGGGNFYQPVYHHQFQQQHHQMQQFGGNNNSNNINFPQQGPATIMQQEPSSFPITTGQQQQSMYNNNNYNPPPSNNSDNNRFTYNSQNINRSNMVSMYNSNNNNSISSSNNIVGMIPNNNNINNINTFNPSTSGSTSLSNQSSSNTFNNNSHIVSSGLNNTFSDFYSSAKQMTPPKPTTTTSFKHGEMPQNLFSTTSTSGITNYQNVNNQSTSNTDQNYQNNQNRTISNSTTNATTKATTAANQTSTHYNDFSATATTNQLQSSPPSAQSPNFHSSSSSSDKNSSNATTTVELPPPPKSKKKKSNLGAPGQLTFTIPPPVGVAAEERFDDVSEAVAFSGAKLFPIACVACRQRHKRCDRTIPSCASCSSKGIECQYRTPRKKGRALQSNDGFHTFTSLDEIKYIPQQQGFSDNETVMNSSSAVMPSSNSLSVSPPKDNFGIIDDGVDILTKKRKKSQKIEESNPKKLAIEKSTPPPSSLPPQPPLSISENVSQDLNNFQPAVVNRPLQSSIITVPPKQQDISINMIQIPSISPSEFFDYPQTQLPMFIPSSSNNNNQNNLPSGIATQPDFTPFNDPNSSVEAISQLLILLLASNNQTYVTKLVKDLLITGNGEGLKKLLGSTFCLENFITTNERLNISAIKKRTVDLYDEIISFGYPIVSSHYIEEALSATNIRAYSSENLALIYAIHAVTCQRLCELDQAQQAYHKSLIELKETTDKQNLVVIATFCNLALYCGGTGDTDTAQQLLASAEVYLINRRKLKLQTNDTNFALNFIGYTGPSFTLFDNLSEDEFKVEKLKAVCSVAAYLGSGTPKPSLYFVLRGYSFAEEIGSFLSECLLLFEGKISKNDLDILTKPINANTFPEYMSVLSRVDSAYSGHESARPYSSMQMKLAASLLLCVLGGTRAWVLNRAGIKGTIIEDYASQVTNLTSTPGFLLLHSLTIQFVAKALEVHYDTVRDAENGVRKNSDMAQLRQTIFTCFNALVELSKRFTRVFRFYPSLLYNTAIRLMEWGFEGEYIDIVLKNLSQISQAMPTPNNNNQTLINNQTMLSNAGNYNMGAPTNNNTSTDEIVGDEVRFNFDQLLSNFVATAIKSPFI